MRAPALTGGCSDRFRPGPRRSTRDVIHHLWPPGTANSHPPQGQGDRSHVQGFTGAPRRPAKRVRQRPTGHGGATPHRLPPFAPSDLSIRWTATPDESEADPLTASMNPDRPRPSKWALPGPPSRCWDHLRPPKPVTPFCYAIVWRRTLRQTVQPTCNSARSAPGRNGHQGSCASARSSVPGPRRASFPSWTLNRAPVVPPVGSVQPSASVTAWAPTNLSAKPESGVRAADPNS